MLTEFASRKPCMIYEMNKIVHRFVQYDWNCMPQIPFIVTGTGLYWNITFIPSISMNPELESIDNTEIQLVTKVSRYQVLVSTHHYLLYLHASTFPAVKTYKFIFHSGAGRLNARLMEIHCTNIFNLPFFSQF